MAKDNGIRLGEEPPDRLVVRLYGHLDEDLGKELLSEVRAYLGGRTDLCRALVDLSGLEGSKVLGRAELRSFQQWLSGRMRRTAYLAATPRFRGLAHIAIHGAKDANAIAVISREQADEWLDGQRTRHELRVSKLGGR